MPRVKDRTLADLAAQHERVMGGAPSAVDAMATKSGTKDKYYQHFVDQIQGKLNKWRDENKNIPAREGMTKKDMEREMLETLRRTLPDNLFNPVLRIPGSRSHPCS